MSEKYDGWIAKDKYGVYWFGTLSYEEWGCKASIKELKGRELYRLKAVKVKFTEVE